MSFDRELKQKTGQMEEILREFMPKEEGYQKRIMEAMNYSLMAGGKRLRPILMAETYSLFGGGKWELIKPFMAAIEMIHTYSLVHDDLPAMDNDEYRRGRKTTHVVYGEAMGILAGDGLLNYAFETAVKAFDGISEATDQDVARISRRVAKALQLLATKAGIYGMIGGQVIDTEEFTGEVTRERLDRIYLLKTSALIEASMMIGAVLAGASEEDVLKTEGIASDIGLAFQIQDDILDVTSTSEKLGKPVHSDEKNDKKTYVSLMGLESAKECVARISKRAIDTYRSLSYENEFLEKLIDMLVNREN